MLFSPGARARWHAPHRQHGRMDVTPALLNPKSATCTKLNKRPSPRKTKKITLTAYADVGSHGGIFTFVGGPVGDAYPGLMHIFLKKVSTYLIPVKIIYEIPVDVPDSAKNSKSSLR